MAWYLFRKNELLGLAASLSLSFISGRPNAGSVSSLLSSPAKEMSFLGPSLEPVDRDDFEGDRDGSSL